MVLQELSAVIHTNQSHLSEQQWKQNNHWFVSRKNLKIKRKFFHFYQTSDGRHAYERKINSSFMSFAIFEPFFFFKYTFKTITVSETPIRDSFRNFTRVLQKFNKKLQENFDTPEMFPWLLFFKNAPRDSFQNANLDSFRHSGVL